MKVINKELQEKNESLFPPLLNGTYDYNNVFAKSSFSYTDYQQLNRFLSEKLKV